MNMTVWYTLFQEKESHLVTYESGPANIQVGYCLVRKDLTKFVTNMKVLPSEECFTQHKPLVGEFKIRKVKNTKRKFVTTRKIWKLLHEGSRRNDFSSYVK